MLVMKNTSFQNTTKMNYWRLKVMEIKDSKGLYTLKFDSARKVLFEAPVGLWTRDEYVEYHSQFENKIGPAAAKQPWSICSDLRKYKMSDLGDVMAKHMDWLASNNVQYSAVIVDSAIVKMQVNRASGSKVQQQAFLTEEEASDWLKSKGF